VVMNRASGGVDWATARSQTVIKQAVEVNSASNAFITFIVVGVWEDF
jgi:hypothetical protein